MQGKKFNGVIFLIILDYCIVIICSEEGEGKSYFISKLHLYKQPFIRVPETNIDFFKSYLLFHFTEHDRKTKTQALW